MFVMCLVAVYLSVIQFEMAGVHVRLPMVSSEWLLLDALKVLFDSFIDTVNACLSKYFKLMELYNIAGYM